MKNKQAIDKEYSKIARELSKVNGELEERGQHLEQIKQECQQITNGRILYEDKLKETVQNKIKLNNKI